MRSVASTWRRLLHVDADEVAALRRVLDELGDVALRELLVDREAEMRELERDVRPQPLRVDAVEHLAVGGDDRARLGLVAHALAEERRVREQALVVQPPQDGDGRVEALAGDEARGAEPEAVPLHEPLQARAVRGREDQAAERRSLPPGRDDPLDFGALRRRSGRGAARAPPARPGRRAGRAPSSTRRGRGSAAARRAARSPSPAASGVGSRTSGTTASGKLAARPETAPAAPAASPRYEQRLGADEDVEPFEEVRLEPLPRAVRDLHPGEVRRALAQPLDHRRAGSRSRSAPRTRRGRTARGAHARAAASKCASSSSSSSAKYGGAMTATASAPAAAACSARATVSCVVCAPRGRRPGSARPPRRRTPARSPCRSRRREHHALAGRAEREQRRRRRARRGSRRTARRRPRRAAPSRSGVTAAASGSPQHGGRL